MNATDTVTIPDQVMARRIGDETVILDLASGTYFGLDAVGARIWDLLSEGRSPEQICAVMLAEYDTSEEVLMKDVLALMEQLLEQNLIIQG